MRLNRIGLASWMVVLGLVSAGCEGPREPELEVPSTYTFKSRFVEGSSVKYTGQTMRHVLISDLKAHIGGLAERINKGFTPGPGQVLEELNFYYDFQGEVAGDVAFKLSAASPLQQRTYGDISRKANLSGKVASVEMTGQHKDWSRDFAGWSGAASPNALVRAWFQELDDLAVARANGVIPREPGGALISKVYVNEKGVDLQQLIQKFLDGAITFSQATDWYLDDDLAGKGLRGDNTKQDGNEPYTALEHHWDEAFGYFGASRDYGDYRLEELAGKGGREGYRNGYFDTNGDGKIDLNTEYNFGHSLNAARRDHGSAASARTDLAASTFKAFVRGRALITAAAGPLSPEQMTELQGLRDLIVSNWEKAIASSAVHYVNKVLKDMSAAGTSEYRFLDHAKHWSEMKGFMLSFQFNPRSPLTRARFIELHAKLGDAPVLPHQAGFAEYKAALLAARDIVREAYQFSPANMGNENGQGGW
jgi:hypothetical protein